MQNKSRHLLIKLLLFLMFELAIIFPYYIKAFERDPKGVILILFLSAILSITALFLFKKDIYDWIERNSK